MSEDGAVHPFCLDGRWDIYVRDGGEGRETVVMGLLGGEYILSIRDLGGYKEMRGNGKDGS